MDIPVRIKGQSMLFMDGKPDIASGSANFVRFMFEFPEDWAGLEVIARWTNGAVMYESELQEGNFVYLPSDIAPGKYRFTLFGSDGEGRTATSMPVSLTIEDSGYDV